MAVTKTNESNKCNGVVTSKLMGIAIVEYGHSDGTICVRPHPDTSLAIGTLVESEFQNDGLCEHRVIATHNVSAPEEKPPLTVTDILQARLTAPDDAPVPQDVIERAKVPPKIKSNPSTAPVRTADIPVEQGYEYNLDEDEIRELKSIRNDEPINTGSKPVSPFSTGFDTGRAPQQPSGPKHRSNKPISPFNWK